MTGASNFPQKALTGQQRLFSRPTFFFWCAELTFGCNTFGGKCLMRSTSNASTLLFWLSLGSSVLLAGAGLVSEEDEDGSPPLPSVRQNPQWAWKNTFHHALCNSLTGGTVSRKFPVVSPARIVPGIRLGYAHPFTRAEDRMNERATKWASLVSTG